MPLVCACGKNFTVDHAMICKRGGFVIQWQNELRDLEVDLLSIVCVEVEPVIQDITEEQLSHVEGLIEHKTQDWTFGRVASGIPRARHSSM